MTIRGRRQSRDAALRSPGAVGTLLAKAYEVYVMLVPGAPLPGARPFHRFEGRAPPLTALALVLSLSGCGSPPAAPGRTITIATFEPGGIYHLLGEALAKIYQQKIPGLTVQVQTTGGSVFNVRAIQRGDADLAFTLSDVAYTAYRRGPGGRSDPHTRLRGIAVLFEGALQIITKADSDVRRISDLRGRRIGIGTPGSGSALVARIVLEASGLGEGDVRAEEITTDQAIAGMQLGTIDAGFVVASYPYPPIARAALTTGLRLVPISQDVVARIRTSYFFFRSAAIPAQTYSHQLTDIETIGVDNLLVCRQDLDEQLVYDLTRVFVDALPELARAHVAAGTIDPDQAPATPIPLHPGAARYYREREVLR